MEDIFRAQRSIDTIRVLAQQALDVVAGEVRQRFITDVPGQQAVYLLKLQEADALLADPQSAPGAHLAAEAAALGSTPFAIAQTVRTTADLWNQALSPAIEGARLGGKKAVAEASAANEASTRQAIEEAYDIAVAHLRAIEAPSAS